jgi:subtilisin family serine protease
MFPAAFAPHPGGVISTLDPDCVPVTSVGATNPNGTTALFSNAGDWVTCRRYGASLVSTVPVNLNGSAQSSYWVRAGAEERATIDPDDFVSGFATWSGTSFAAPALAGEIAQKLAEGGCGHLGPVDLDTAVQRGWAAFSGATQVKRP